MSITATELKMNLGKYLLLAAYEDIFITRNGHTVAKLVAPEKNKLEEIDALFGSIPPELTLEESKNERLSHI